MLNADRQRHGLPAGVVERPDWTAACQQHVAYMDANDIWADHGTDLGKPGATPEGAWAGRNSVLGDRWEASAPGPEVLRDGAWTPEPFTVYLDAPIHRMQLLAPALAELGAFDRCQTTWPGYTRPTPAPQLFTVPGDRYGYMPYEERALELPFVPGDFVGLPAGTTTGPHMFVMALGTARGHLASASLTGPEGPVEVRTVDNSTPDIGGYLPPGGVIIPVQPLQPLSDYTAAATFVDRKGVSLSRTWSFRTDGVSSGIYVDASSYGPRPIKVESESPAPVTLTVARSAGGPVTETRVLRPGDGWEPTVWGDLRVCAAQEERAPYRAE
ncbi:MAG TPA: CAP domain-containing protein, partial [Capillimicrobium sp.]